MRAFYKRLAVSSLLMLLALAATAGLGVWQYTVAHRNDVIETTAARASVEYESVATLGEYLSESNYGQSVKVGGRLDCTQAVEVTFAQSRSAWQVCPLKLTDGSVVAVAFAAVDPNLVIDTNFSGRLQPAHSVEALPIRYEKTPTVESLNTDELALRWQANVHDGYVVADSSLPAQIGVPLAESLYVWPPVGIQLRNLFYAWQWWIFAAFSVFIWAKYIIDEYRGQSKSNMGEIDE